MLQAPFRFNDRHSFPSAKPAQYFADPMLLFTIENLPVIFEGKCHMIFTVSFFVN